MGDNRNEPPVDPFPTQGPGDAFPPIRRSAGIFPPHPNDPAPAPQEPEAPEPQTDWIAAADPHDMPVQDHPVSRITALGRFAFPPEPPLDDEAAAARDRRWTSRAILTTAVFMAVFNIAAVQSWVRTQPPGWISQTVGQLSDVWADRLSLLGADQPRRGAREAWDAARDSRFPGQDPAGE